jgi:hypothetical protein
VGEVVSLREVEARRARKAKRKKNEGLYALMREQQRLLEEIQSRRALRLEPPLEEPSHVNGGLDPYEPW